MHSEGNQHGDFSSSLTDLMASVAVVFLLIAAAMITLVRITQDENSKKYETMVEEKEKILTKKSVLFKEIAKILDVDIGTNERTYDDDCYSIDAQEEFRLRIRFKEANMVTASSHGIRCRSLTFEQNQFALKFTDPQIQELLSKLSRIFVKTCNQKNIVSRVSLEGHTDQKRYNDTQSQCQNFRGDPDCGNLYLSAQRAREIFLRVRNSLNVEDRRCLDQITETSGRGSMMPVSKTLPPDSAEHRRVELVIDFRQPILRSGDQQ